MSAMFLGTGPAIPDEPYAVAGNILFGFLRDTPWEAVEMLTDRIYVGTDTIDGFVGVGVVAYDDGYVAYGTPIRFVTK